MWKIIGNLNAYVSICENVDFLFVPNFIYCVNNLFALEYGKNQLLPNT